MNPNDEAIYPSRSIAGSNSDHTRAANITPDEKPRINFSILEFNSFLRKKTPKEPRLVPIQGIRNKKDK